MNRRSFVKLASSATAISMLPYACAKQSNNPKFKLGYQLFSIRDQMEKDPIATLKLLKAMGYEDFEHYGFDGETGNYYGLHVKAFREVLEELNITVSSGHYPFSDYLSKSNDELKRYTDNIIKSARVVGSDFVTWPWLAPEYRNINGFKLVAKKCNQIAEQVTDAGLGFAYHNHGFEFEDLGGIKGFDIVTNETDPKKVKLQLDMYWVMHSANQTPKEIIATHPKRVAMWHIKDMHKDSRDYTELGNGSIDFPSIIPSPKDSGLVYYYIEQGGNYAYSSIDSAKASIEYFKQHLQKFL